MVTGDNPDTAVHISRQAGILRDGVDFIRGEKETQQVISSDGEEVVHMLDRSAFTHRGPCGLLYRSPYVVMTGPEFRKFVLDKNEQIIQENMDQVWPYLRVLARSSPTDKYSLVSGMKKSELYTNSYFVEETGIYPDGQVIAVTGDGSNDAPALAKADVGFAMGITGTAVAKDAADIILLDDDFASIVQACLWGRNIHDCISKFLQFQLTVNIAAVCIACLGAFRNSESPLRTTQLLWVNLIMDSLGALALAAEPPTDSLLQRAPYGRHKSLVTASMWVKMLGQAAYQMVVLVLLLFYGAGPVIPEEMYDVLDHPMYRCNSTQFCLDYPEHCGEGLIEKYTAMFGIEANVPVPNGSGRAGTKHMPSEHYTIMFHAFVWMTLFNWINCRKLHLNELNPFQGILSNPVFCIIWILCAAMQWGLVEVGAQNDKADACHNLPARTKGLTWDQHMFCMAMGVVSIPLQVVISYIARLFVADEK
jgi:Ca2+ transporting ATPase